MHPKKKCFHWVPGATRIYAMSWDLWSCASTVSCASSSQAHTSFHRHFHSSVDHDHCSCVPCSNFVSRVLPEWLLSNALECLHLPCNIYNTKEMYCSVKCALPPNPGIIPKHFLWTLFMKVFEASYLILHTWRLFPFFSVHCVICFCVPLTFFMIIQGFEISNL